MQNAKQEFPCQSLESFSEEYNNMENKILDFQFGPVCTIYSVGNEQDEAKIQYDCCITPEWCNCEKFEEISPS